MAVLVTRAGRFVKQAAGFRAFVPAPLPSDPPVGFDASTSALLSRADQAIGRLDGAISTLPDPDLFVAMYVRREAVLSSQIEGTQSSLDDVLFLDGNGRIGRLLITFLLHQRGVLHRPLLYPSHFLKGHRTEYYDRLTAVRTESDWEGWLGFFLRGIAETAEEATATACAIVRMHGEHRTLVQEHGLGLNALRLLDALFRVPLVNARWVEDRLEIAYATATKLFGRFQEIGLVEETTGGKRFRRFRYTPYLLLFEDDASLLPAERDHEVPIQATESAAS